MVSLSCSFSQHHLLVFFRLEKEYTALKSKENEDQIELRVSNLFVCLFDLILYVPSTIFQLYRDGSSWVEPVLSQDKCVLLKDHNAVTPVRLEPAARVSNA